MSLSIELTIRKGPDGRPSLLMNVDKDGETYHVGFYDPSDARLLATRLDHGALTLARAIRADDELRRVNGQPPRKSA